MDDVLTPRQREAREQLLDIGGSRPSFAPDLAPRLRGELEGRLAGVAARLDHDMVVAKGMLSQVHACEGNRVASEAAGFTWSAATARGSVAHKAVELTIGLAAPGPPLELVDMAIDRLLEDRWGPSSFLADAPPVELAELRMGAADLVTKMADELPPLKRAWRPRLESTLAAPLFGGRIQLRGKVDLALGMPVGHEARVLIIDFKTGRPHPTHVDDLRFYALLETLRVGVPPFRVASWYLDSGTWHAEDVDLDLLGVAVRRTADGVEKLVELHHDGRPPVLSPGPTCTWCPAAEECEGPAAWEASRAEQGWDG